MAMDAVLAVQRFGLGARPGEIEAVGGDPRRWLLAQHLAGADQPTPIAAPFPSTGELARDHAAQDRARRLAKQQGLDQNQTKAALAQFEPDGQRFHDEMLARFALGFTTAKPFAERLVWFWSNHFAIGTQSGATAFAGDYERTAIRPYINGRFEDMLVAVVTHPAMQLYLSNAQSIGPDSVAGQRSGKGLNENLGREVMELHTLGVDGGYTQADVLAMAKLLTGWGIDDDGGSGFRFYPQRHEPGDIVLRGKTYPSGEEGGRAALHDLAHDPHTAHHIATKLAAHFLADTPPAKSVARLRKTFLETGGDLVAMSETLLRDPAAFALPLQKFRPPVAFITAAYRMFGWPRSPGDPQGQLAAALASARLMGEFPLSAPSPKGWPDDARSWAGANAILNRIDWAHAAGRRFPDGFDAIALAQSVMGSLVQPATVSAMRTAPDSGTALALLMASPEFQYR